MSNESIIQVFDGKNIRIVWNEQEEKYYFAVADIVEALTDTTNPTDYLKKMRQRDKELAKGWGQIVTPLSVQTEAVNRGLIAQHNREFSASYSQSHLKRQNLSNNGWLRWLANALTNCKTPNSLSNRLWRTIVV